MHSDLSANLHTPECNKLISALFQCHRENKFRKFLGACNDANWEMLKCLKKEREERRRTNAENGAKRREKLRGIPVSNDNQQS
ncbi:COX assembly mitochondrial protein 2 [Orchesella cincta]|uniref:COX assembly mitochondrial protein n=1 Tax=Orchesella cincta TaxID=48709 RepID=A0A1D2MXF7_ORCCI|nr:COX assembly mitochondrial protein 2 [Orchesella cincta]